MKTETESEMTHVAEGVRELPRHEEIWRESGGRTEDTWNALGIICLVLGVIGFVYARSFFRSEEHDAQGWAAVSMLISAAAAMWGLWRVLKTYGKWSLAIVLTIVGAGVMLVGWIWFEGAPAPILVGGFTMVTGAVLRKA